MGAVTKRVWERKHQHFERDWWGDCCNTYGEETKQVAYMRAMGFNFSDWFGGDRYPVFDLDASTVIDIGGGPVSVMLKASQRVDGIVIDPCEYPAWTEARYHAHGIRVHHLPAEEALTFYGDKTIDLALIYNCLQHTIDPELIVREAMRVADRVGIFEWVGQPAYTGHPHELNGDDLDRWVGGQGYHLWYDEQYNIIGPESDSPVRQHAWAGIFE